MVKSKKLSRGSLAVLLLALVLACSMVIGMTGAYFTHSAGTTTNVSSFKYGDVTVAITAGAVLHFDAGYGDSHNPATYNSGASIDRPEVVPGDWLVATVTIRNAGNASYDVDAYYGIKVGSKLYKIVDNALVEYAANGNADTLLKEESKVAYLETPIETTVVYGEAVVRGATVSLTGEGASWTVYVVQKDNLTAQQGLSQLATLASVTLANA